MRAAVQNLSIQDDQARQFILKFGLAADRLDGQVLPLGGGRGGAATVVETRHRIRLLRAGGLLGGTHVHPHDGGAEGLGAAILPGSDLSLPSSGHPMAQFHALRKSLFFRKTCWHSN